MGTANEAGIIAVSPAASIKWLRSFNLGRLPGDNVVERPGVHIYFPIVACLVTSVVLMLPFWILRK